MADVPGLDELRVGVHEHREHLGAAGQRRHRGRAVEAVLQHHDDRSRADQRVEPGPHVGGLVRLGREQDPRDRGEAPRVDLGADGERARALRRLDRELVERAPHAQRHGMPGLLQVGGEQAADPARADHGGAGHAHAPGVAEWTKEEGVPPRHAGGVRTSISAIFTDAGRDAERGRAAVWRKVQTPATPARRRGQ
jgi:hypothetical protein